MKEHLYFEASIVSVDNDIHIFIKDKHLIFETETKLIKQIKFDQHSATKNLLTAIAKNGHTQLRVHSC